jgi:hypothetical protein
MKKLAYCSMSVVLLILVMVVTNSFAHDAKSCSYNSVVPNPNVLGPIPANVPLGNPTHDYTWLTPDIDLFSYGYVQEEFFIEGNANRYNTPAGATGSIIAGGPYPYKTRIVVRRPISRKDFNGTVLLEWANVTAGYDSDAHWAVSWKHFMRSGYAWVSVSAQRVGIHQPVTGLRAWSLTRYGSLDVTVGGTILDDSLCYDIYAQVAQAIQCPKGIDPMGGLPVKLIIAMGASQSASRLVTYYNSIQPLHNLFEAYYFLVGGTGLRTDLNVKKFQILSETDLLFLGAANGRQPDTDTFRSWEVAGAAHSGYTSFLYRLPLRQRDNIAITTAESACAYPAYSRTPFYAVLNAAYDYLVRWVEYGHRPPSAPKIEITSLGPPVVIARDSLGLAKGGIRLPQVTVPTALNNGTNGGPAFCILYGTYQHFDKGTLDALYPHHNDYVRAFNHAVMETLKAGYIVKEDAEEMLVEAPEPDIFHPNIFHW